MIGLLLGWALAAGGPGELWVERGLAAQLEGRVEAAREAAELARAEPDADWRAHRLYLWALDKQGLGMLADVEFAPSRGDERLAWAWARSDAETLQTLTASPQLDLALAELTWQRRPEAALAMLLQPRLPEAASLRLRALLDVGDTKGAARASANMHGAWSERPDAWVGLFSGTAETGKLRKERARALEAVRGGDRTEVVDLYRRWRVAMAADDVELRDDLTTSLQAAGEAVLGRPAYSPAMRRDLARVLAMGSVPLPRMNAADTRAVVADLAVRLEDAGRLEDADAAWRLGRERADDSDLAAQHAVFLLRRERTDEAAEAAGEALLLAALGADNDRGRLDLQQLASDLAVAHAILAEALADTRPDDAWAHGTLARILGLPASVPGKRPKGMGELLSRYGAVADGARFADPDPIDRALHGASLQVRALPVEQRADVANDALHIAGIRPSAEDPKAVSRRRFAQASAIQADAVQGPDALVWLTTAALLGSDVDVHARRGRLLAALGQRDASFVALAVAAGLGDGSVHGELEAAWGARNGAWEEAAVAVFAAWQERAPGALVPRPPDIAPTSVRTGEVVEPFTIELASGETVSSEQLRGQVVVLNFWASWCGPCMMELPELATYARDLEGREDVSILAVSVDQDQRSYERVLTRDGLDGLDMAWDPQLGIEMGVSSLPTTWVLDAEGRLHNRHTGYSREMARLLHKEVEGLTGQ